MLALSLAVMSSAALAAPPAEDALSNKQETFGAVVAPTTLPAGANAVYGFVGVPEVGAGYRQGFGGYELEGRARLNYLQLSLAAEVLGRYAVPRTGPLELAPFLGLGIVGNTGSTYFDTYNFSYVGLRVLAGLVAGYRVSDTLRVLGEFDVPFDLPVGQGGARLAPVAGGGAELYLANDFSVLALGQLGVDVAKLPNGSTVTRLGYAVRLGLGFRIF